MNSSSLAFAKTEDIESKNKIFNNKFREIYEANRKSPRAFIRKIMMKNSGEEVEFFDSKISEYKIVEFPEIEFLDNGFNINVNNKSHELRLLDVSEQRLLLNNEELELNKYSSLHKKFNRIVSLLEKKDASKGAFLDLLFKSVIPEAHGVSLVGIGGLALVVLGVVYKVTNNTGYMNAAHENLWEAVMNQEGLQSVQLQNCDELRRKGILIIKTDITNSMNQRVIQNVTYDFRSVSEAAIAKEPNRYKKNVEYEFIGKDELTNELYDSLFIKNGVPKKHENVVLNKNNYGYTMIFDETSQSPANGLYFPELLAPAISLDGRTKNDYKPMNKDNPDWRIFEAAYECCKTGTDCQKDFNILAKKNKTSSPKFNRGSDLESDSGRQKVAK